MGATYGLLLWLLLCLLLCTAPTRAFITTSTATFAGPGSIKLAEDYGMVQQGVINVNLLVTPQPVPGTDAAALSPSTFATRYPYYSPASMGGYFLIVVLNSDQKARWYGNLGQTGAALASLCMQPATIRHYVAFDAQGRGNFTYTLSSVNEDDQYSLGLLQCYQLKSPSLQLRITATSELYNAQPGLPSATFRSYLSIEAVPQIRVLQFELLVLALFVAVLLGQIALSMKPWLALRLHFLFLLVITLGLALSAATYAQQSYLNSTGLQGSPAAYALGLAVSVIDHFNTTSQLVCFLLLSLGWCTTRASLAPKELRIFAAAISLFFIIGMTNAVCTDNGSTTCQSLSLVTYILRLLLILTIIIAMNFTVTQLRAGLIHSPWIPSTPVQYARVKQFQTFRVVFILYLLLPTAFVVVQGSMFSWRESWLVFLLGEVLNWYIYLHVGSTFAPLQEPFLIRAFDNTFTTALRANTE